jgi:hypothetical protein
MQSGQADPLQKTIDWANDIVTQQKRAEMIADVARQKTQKTGRTGRSAVKAFYRVNKNLQEQMRQKGVF